MSGADEQPGPGGAKRTDAVLCELCGAEAAHNFHHLIPRTLHTNKWFKRQYTRKELSRGLELCRACHRSVHRLIPDEKELGRHFNTPDKLLAHPEVGKYVAWKRKRGGAAGR